MGLSEALWLRPRQMFSKCLPRMARATRAIRRKGYRLPGRIDAGIIWKDGRCLGGQERRHLRLRCLLSPTILSTWGRMLKARAAWPIERECVHGFRGGAVLNAVTYRATSSTYSRGREEPRVPGNGQNTSVRRKTGCRQK